MVMVADLVPGLKRWLRGLGLTRGGRAAVLRMVVAFLLQPGTDVVSAGGGGGALRCAASRADQPFVAASQLSRARISTRACGSNCWLWSPSAGCSCSSSTRRCAVRPARRRRTPTARATASGGRGKAADMESRNIPARAATASRWDCLITPSGLRVPFSIPHYTREYCRKKGLAHRTTAEAAADLIRGCRCPKKRKSMVLGDTAYEAEVVREACAERGYAWIFPCNPNASWPAAKAAAKGAFAAQGSVVVVAGARQVLSGAGTVRQLSTSVAAPDRAESETADVLRPPGETERALASARCGSSFRQRSRSSPKPRRTT